MKFRMLPEDDDNVCECCGRKKPGRRRKWMLPPEQIAAIVSDKRTSIQVATAHGISDSYVTKIKRAHLAGEQS